MRHPLEAVLMYATLRGLTRSLGMKYPTERYTKHHEHYTSIYAIQLVDFVDSSYPYFCIGRVPRHHGVYIPS